MKTAVETIFFGKDRVYNRCFLQMCAHHLVEPTACTPGAGWEKGEVENQVGMVRERFFKPRLRFKSYEEMNARLLDRCVAYAKAHRHPEFPDHAGRFDGFHSVPAAVSKTCLARFDNNKYSSRHSPSADRSRFRPMPTASSSARTVRSWASTALLRPRRDDLRPWHYVPVLARKSGALRNGAPFKAWVLPNAMA